MKIQKRVLIGVLLFLSIGTGCVKTSADKGSARLDRSAAQTAAAESRQEVAPDARKATPSVIKAEPIGQGIEWLTLEEAYARNQKEPRKIFVDVYTDWCGWCKKMDKETFANEAVAAYVNEHYYAVKLDAESARSFEMAGQQMTERQVAQQLGVRSFPTIVFIHEDFQRFQPLPGYRPAKEFKEVLEKFKAIDIYAKEKTEE